MKIEVVIRFIFICLLFACSEQPSEPIRQLADNIPNEYFFGPYNTDNPYDSVGIKHNMCVNYALSFLQSTDTTRELCFTTIRTALINYGLRHTSFDQSDLEMIYDSSYALVGRTQYSQFMELDSNPGDWTPSEHAFIVRLANIIALNTPFEIACDSISSIETEITSSSNPLRSILEFVSVFKHSYYYWNAATSGFYKFPICRFFKEQEEYLYPDIIRLADDVGYKYGIEIGDNDFCLAKELACMSSTVAAIMYYTGDEYPIHISVFLGL